MKQLIFSFITISLLITSCDEAPIEIPSIEGVNTEKTVLIEEFTGVQCPNCPKGTTAVETILSTFGYNVYAIGVHGILQAEPIPDKSKYDFRNKYAIDIESSFSYLGKPAALINRIKFEEEDFDAVDNVDKWFSYVEGELLNTPLEVRIELDDEIVVNSDNSFDLNVDLTPVIDLDGEHRISIFVTESGIVDPQENQGEIIHGYTHNHVLRDMMTASLGDVVDDLEKDITTTRKYTYTIPDDFVKENLEIVVSIHRNSTNDKSIIQTKGIKLK